MTFTDGSSKLYRLVTEKANFDEAVQICKEEDAYLAEFMNSEQMEKVGLNYLNYIKGFLMCVIGAPLS